MPLLKICIRRLGAPASRFVPPQADPFVQEIFGLQSQRLEAGNLISRDLIPFDRHTGFPVEFSLFSTGQCEPAFVYLETKWGVKLRIYRFTAIEDNLGLVRGWTRAQDLIAQAGWSRAASRWRMGYRQEPVAMRVGRRKPVLQAAFLVIADWIEISIGGQY